MDRCTRMNTDSGGNKGRNDRMNRMNRMGGRERLNAKFRGVSSFKFQVKTGVSREERAGGDGPKGKIEDENEDEKSSSLRSPKDTEKRNEETALSFLAPTTRRPRPSSPVTREKCLENRKNVKSEERLRTKLWVTLFGGRMQWRGRGRRNLIFSEL